MSEPHATSHRAAIDDGDLQLYHGDVIQTLPTIEELCEAMASTGDRPGFTATRQANGFSQYAAAVLAMLKERAQ